MEQIDQTSLENLEKTVSFKMAKEELSLLKGHCEGEGTTLSEFIRKRLHTSPAVDQGHDALRRELLAGYEARLATDKLTRSETELARVQQALVVEQEKRKKLKKCLAETEASLRAVQTEAEGGLGSLVTKNPAIGELLGNVLVRIAESPRTQKTLGALMGVAAGSDEPSADDQAFVKFGHDLKRQLSTDELQTVFEICYLLSEHKRLIGGLLKGLQAAVAKMPPPAPAAPAPQGG